MRWLLSLFRWEEPDLRKIQPDWRWLAKDIQRQRDELNLALAEEKAQTKFLHRELEIARRLLMAKSEELARIQKAIERK